MDVVSRPGQEHWTIRRLWPALLLLVLTACGGAPAGSSATPTVAAGPAATVAAAEPAGAPTGRLIFLRRRMEGVAVIAYDLAAAAPAVLFQAEPDAWLSGAALHPDGDLVLAYAPPPPGRQPQLGYAGIYRLPAGASAPEEMQSFVANELNYSTPFFNADGSQLYYLETTVNADVPGGLAIRLLRQAWPDGAAEAVATQVTWPRLSADGARLVYIQPAADGSEMDLYVMDLAAGTTAPVPLTDFDLTIDAPLFDPAGEWIYFSAVTEAAASLGWFDRLLGVQIAAAHAVPSDWWRVPAGGGRPEKLTDVRRVSMSGAFAADGRRFAYISGDGLYLMNPDGSDAETLIASAPLFGVLAWVE